MKITFGKYKNQDLSIVNDDENYKNWLLNQSFFKDKYPQEYKYLKNYKKPFNFFECMYKNLDNDCLEMVSDYLKDDHDYLSFTFRADLIDHKIKTSFKHRENILEVITILNNKPKPIANSEITDYNLFEFRLFHQNNLERFMYNCFNNGITRGDDLYNKKYYYLFHEGPFEQAQYLDNNKVGFGKYKDVKIKDLVKYRDSYTGCKDYRMKKWIEWAEENNVFDNKPILKYYIDTMKDMDYARLESRTYYN